MVIISNNLFDVSKKCFDLIYACGFRLSFAESCTGGLLSFVITLTTGASNILDRSFIVYSTQSKVDILNVSKKTIDAFTVVSPEVSVEMVCGLSNISNSNILIGITGEVGPISSSGVEVGIAYLSILFNDKVIIKKINLSSKLSRVKMQMQMTKQTLELIIQILNDFLSCNA